jgi:hypothetical protein
MLAHTKTLFLAVALAFLAPAALGCGDDGASTGKTNVMPGDPFQPYDAEGGDVTVIGAGEATGGGAAGGGVMTETVGETAVLVGSPEGDTGSPGEVCISDTLCEVPPTDSSDWCEREGGPVDLIYVDGELVETICYPPAEDPERPTEVVEGAGDVDVAQNANNTTIVFDEATNGMPIEGNITVDGNNVAIYGNGPDDTTVDGDVALDGNNIRIRGVTITGDLVIRKNNVAIVLCRILGNLRLETMSTNGSVVAENDIWGDFTSDSNGNLFVGNDVSGTWEHTGNGNTCDRNAAFEDADMDDVLDDDERGELLTCP